jgi:FkbM family methyltransferase
MAMIAYGQNYEDVLLNRLFAPDYLGFYVDIGANDPMNNSVTYHFYQRGWSGINIEPGAVFERLSRFRPRDVNLQVAVSQTCGEATFFDYPGAAANATLSQAIARDNERFGIVCVPRQIKLITLRSLCEQYVKDRTIDFMSIDVEGHEMEVIAGGAWDRYRPRVLVIEATWPHTSQPSYEGWEPLLLAHGYRFAFFDGLNRFYLREEDAGLQERLMTPACTLDDYVPYLYDRLLKKYVGELEKCLCMLDSPRIMFWRSLKLLPRSLFRKVRQAAALLPWPTRAGSRQKGSAAPSQDRAA